MSLEGEARKWSILVADGRLEVTAGGELLFDRKAEGGVYPEMKRVREIKKRIAQMLESRA